MRSQHVSEFVVEEEEVKQKESRTVKGKEKSKPVSPKMKQVEKRRGEKRRGEERRGNNI